MVLITTQKNLNKLYSLASEKDLETCTIRIDSGNLVVISVYRSPTGNLDLFWRKSKNCQTRYILF